MHSVIRRAIPPPKANSLRRVLPASSNRQPYYLGRCFLKYQRVAESDLGRQNTAQHAEVVA